MMKKIFTLLALAITISISAQKSILLRLNYNVGDQYLVTMNVSQEEMMNMNISMKMDVKEVLDTIYNIEMSIDQIEMKMSQGGIEMAYNSNQSDEELDEMGKMMKTQFQPLLAAQIFTTMSNRAETLETIVEPDIAGIEDFTKNSGTVIYPKKAVKVGDTWTAEQSDKGVTMGFSYTVKAIEKSTVNVEISGVISQTAEGTISGVMEIDKATGNVNTSSMTMHMTVNGQEVDTNISMSTTKL